MQLRQYQQDALNLTYDYLSKFDGNPCVVLPTGSGKSVVIAALCKDAIQSWPETRILKITSRKELIEQNAEKLLRIWPNAPLGIYSASIGKRDLGEPITFAGIQSIRNRALDIGHVDLVIVDECHEIGHEEAGSYRKIIGELMAINKNLRVIGFTATPYRLGHGLITDKPALFDQLIEPTSIRILQEQGYLSKLQSKHTALTIDVSSVHKRGGEYIESELQAAVDTDLNTQAAIVETIRRAKDRKAWLFFCAGVEHAYHVRDALRGHGITSETVTGDTPKDEREEILEKYKAGKIKALTNANILTTGFDYPNIDLIAMLRPTCSPGLYMQMVGRGLRIKSHGGDCMILDFAGNISMHGPIIAVKPPDKARKTEGVAPSKICPECDEMLPIQSKVCTSCGHIFTKEENDKFFRLHDDDIMGSDMVNEMDVDHWWWDIQLSRSSGKEMLVCRYYPDIIGGEPIAEYFCVFHEGFAGHKARREMLRVCNSAGLTNQPQETAELNEARHPDKIKYIKDGKFYRVIDRIWSNFDEFDTIPF